MSCGRIPVGHLTEIHLGQQLRIPVATGRCIEGVLTGLWPFAEGAHVLRLEPVSAPSGTHIVHNSVEVEVW